MWMDHAFGGLSICGLCQTDRYDKINIFQFVGGIHDEGGNVESILFQGKAISERFLRG